MKMFIWSDPYLVHYGSSLLVVVAETLEEAKKQAAEGLSWKYGQYQHMSGSLEIMVRKLGEPTRVLPVPCAEWHEWSE